MVGPVSGCQSFATIVFYEESAYIIESTKIFDVTKLYLNGSAAKGSIVAVDKNSYFAVCCVIGISRSIKIVIKATNIHDSKANKIQK